MSIALRQQEAYQNMQLQSASRGDLLLETFDWLTAAVRRARRSAANGRTAAGRRALMNAQSAIVYLMGTLDMDAGGALAARLRALYLYLLRRLAEASVEVDAAIIDEVDRLLSPLSEAWHQAVVSQQEAP